MVWVQFGRNYVQGVVISLSSASAVSEEETRDILHPVEPSPLIGSLGLELAEWIGQTYLCSPFEAVAPMLPPGFRAHQESRLTAVPGVDDDASLASFREPVREAWRELSASGKACDEPDFLKRIETNPNRLDIARRDLRRLVDRGMVKKDVSLPRPRTHRYRRALLPGHYQATDDDTADAIPTRCPPAGGLAVGGSGIADSLRRHRRRRRQPTRCCERGLIAEEWRRVKTGDTARRRSDRTASPVALHSLRRRRKALARITATLDSPDAMPRSMLLHGVTGSGKTEVYLRAIAHAVELGKQAIYLVPEISLTPQTVGLVNERFPGRAAVLHHRLTDRERFDQWWRIRDGLADVVVGPRSALFAPAFNLGLDHRGRGARTSLQAGGVPAVLPRPRRRAGAGPTLRGRGRDGVGDARCSHVPRCSAGTPPLVGIAGSGARIRRSADTPGGRQDRRYAAGSCGKATAAYSAAA